MLSAGSWFDTDMATQLYEELSLNQVLEMARKMIHFLPYMFRDCVESIYIIVVFAFNHQKMTGLGHEKGI